MNKRVLFAFYLVSIHVVIAVLLVKTNAVPRALAKAGLVEPAQEYIELRHRIFQERRDPIVPPGSAIFLGDSITQGFVVSLVDPVSVNFGIGQQTTTQLIQALPGYSSLNSAGEIFLMIGVNDISIGKFAGLESRYRTILEYLPEHVPLIWSGLMPAQNRAEEVKGANQIIKRLCRERDHCVYVDTFQPLSDNNGNPAEGMMLDGVHPAARGYEIWAQLLREAKSDFGESRN